MRVKNLWGAMPDIDSICSPHQILLEQGSYLAETTNGLLDFDIERSQKVAIFSYRFLITVPILKFRQGLLRVTHDIKLFPAILRHEQSGEEYTAKGQDEFEEDLSKMLSSEETRSMIFGLMAKSKLEAELSK